MVFSGLSKHLFDLLLFLTYGLEFLQKIEACDDSYQCRFGQQCCKATKTCQASCSEKHGSNIGVIIGIVAAVALGNALFWLTFCCLCWCKGNRKSRFRYRPFGENEDNRTPNNNDDVVGDDMINNDGMINNKDEVIDNDDSAINDHIIDDETTKVLGIKDERCKEEISLSIIKIKRPILKTNRHLGECSNRNASNV